MINQSENQTHNQINQDVVNRDFINKDFTDDFILNGKIFLRQPKNGYRVAVDPFILAAFSGANIRENESILDAGCGVGAVSLILKFQHKSAKITAIDIDKNMCDLCRYNAEKNNLNLEVKNIGIEKIHEEISEEKFFDNIVTNPPFFDMKSFRVSKNKKTAKFETLELKDWISYCFKKLKEKGKFSIIHNASRIGDILETFKKQNGGGIVITPIFSKKESKEANRIVVQCIKGSKRETKINYGLVLHENNGEYSEKMQKILRFSTFGGM